MYEVEPHEVVVFVDKNGQLTMQGTVWWWAGSGGGRQEEQGQERGQIKEMPRGWSLHDAPHYNSPGREEFLSPQQVTAWLLKPPATGRIMTPQTFKAPVKARQHTLKREERKESCLAQLGPTIQGHLPAPRVQE